MHQQLGHSPHGVVLRVWQQLGPSSQQLGSTGLANLAEEYLSTASSQCSSTSISHSPHDVVLGVWQQLAPAVGVHLQRKHR